MIERNPISYLVPCLTFASKIRRILYQISVVELSGHTPCVWLVLDDLLFRQARTFFFEVEKV